MGAELLAGASPERLHIRFYVDGYHGYLLAQKVAAIHHANWEYVKSRFPENDGRFSIFDFTPAPEKLAEILAGLLAWSANLMVQRAERLFAQYGEEVIAKSDVDWLSNPFFTDLFGRLADFTAEGKTFIQLEQDGVVFAPRYDAVKLLRDLAYFERDVKPSKTVDTILLKKIEQERQKVERGDFEASQRFYISLGAKLGGLSQEGFLKVIQGNTKSIIGEKAVDGDFNTELTSDCAANAAHLFVLVTNDGDHAPAAKKARSKGCRIAVLSHADNPAAGLREAVGDNCILNLLDCSTGFDFSDVWLRSQDRESFDILEDIQRQWRWWQHQGLVK